MAAAPATSRDLIFVSSYWLSVVLLGATSSRRPVRGRRADIVCVSLFLYRALVTRRSRRPASGPGRSRSLPGCARLHPPGSSGQTLRGAGTQPSARGAGTQPSAYRDIPITPSRIWRITFVIPTNALSRALCLGCVWVFARIWGFGKHRRPVGRKPPLIADASSGSWAVAAMKNRIFKSIMAAPTAPAAARCLADRSSLVRASCLRRDTDGWMFKSRIGGSGLAGGRGGDGGDGAPGR